jgi:hypothetical protein
MTCPVTLWSVKRSGVNSPEEAASFGPISLLS